MTAVTYARAPDVLWRRVLDETMVRWLDGRTTVLRGTSCIVWEQLSSPATATSLALDLRDDLARTGRAAELDVAGALLELEALGLVERR